MAADGSVVFSIGADDAEAQKKLNQLRRDIEKTEKAINSTTEKRSGIAESLSQAREEAEQTASKIGEIKAQMADYQGILMGKLKGDITPEQFYERRDQQQALTAELAIQEKLYAKQSANVAKLEGQEASLTSQIQNQTAQLETQREEAGAVERTLAQQSTSTMPNIRGAIEQVNTSLKKGFKNILKWGFGIRSAFILIRRLRSAIKEGISDYAKGDPETQANLDALKTSLNGLKASWGAAFAPIVNAVIPLLQKLIGWLQTAAEYVSMFFNAISGKGTYKKAIANNAALARSYGGAGKAAKDAKKQLMGFDEINKLNAEDNSGGGGGGSMPLANYVDEDIPDKFKKVIDFIKQNIYELETIIGDALIAIGAILLFTWTKPILGLGMIVAGLAMKYNVAMNWDALPEAMKKEITLIDGLLGTALLAIGAILAFSNPASMALGIGLMAAGAVMLGSAVALNWDSIKNYVQNNLNDILVILGLGLFAIGAIMALCCPALLPLGIGLMAAGGVSFLAGTAMSIDWDAVKEKVRNVVEKIKTFIDSLKKKWEEMKTAAGELKQSIVTKFEEIRTGIKTKIDAARDAVRSAVEKIKEFFRFEWKLPEIKMPHITVSWENLDGNNPIAKLLGIGSIPHLGIQWYARGGIVNGATLFGAGEAGKEAIVPLERNTEWIDAVANGIIDGLTGNDKLADYISGRVLPAIVNGSVVPPRALSGGGSMFTDGDIQRLVNGLTAAFSEAGNEEHTPVIIDGRVVAEIVTRHQRRMERSYA